MLWLGLRGPGSPSETANWITRFSRLGVVLIGVIIVSGFLRAAVEVSGPHTLAQSDYGRVLIGKHLLFVAVLVAAGVNQVVLAPKVRTAVASGLSPSAIVASIRRFASIELAASLGMLIAAAALTELAPADAPLAIDVAAKPMTINQRAVAGDLHVWLLGRLEGASGDRFTITVEDADGRTPADLQKVIVQSSTVIEGESVGDRFDAEPFSGSPGSYVFPAIRLGLPGAWELSIIVRRAGLEDVATTVSVDMSGAGSSAPRLANDQWRWPRPTIPAWLFGFLAVTALIGGVAAVKLLRGIEPFAAGIILTMTALIVAGFAVQGYRQTIPVSAGRDLVNPQPADVGSIERGKDAYRAFCLECHAADGRGIDEENSEHEHAGTSLTDRRTQGQTDGDLYWSISYGVGGTEMPAYDAALTEQERWDLVNYLRELNDLPPLATPAADS
jgi:mono/diheme cytochrome c family protein